MEPTGTYLDDLPESSRAAASPAPPPPPEEQTGTYLDDLPRDRWSPQQRLSHTLLKHARAWSPWEKVSQDLQQLGVDPEQHRESFQKLIPALRLDEARDRLSDQQETTSSLLSRHSPLPGHSVTLSFNATREYAAAKKRLEEGTPQPEDYQTIAGYERVQELDRSRPMWGKIGLQALKVPAMVGEFIGGGTILNRAGAGVMAAGRMAGLLAPAAPAAAGATVAIPKLLSTAGLTELGKGVGMAAATAPLVPSAWVEHWMRGNMEQGRDPADLAGLPAALALGMLQVSVLGAIGKIAGAVPGSGVGPWLNRIVRSVNTGAAGSQAADTAARVVGLSKEYGVLEDLWTGKWGEGGEKLATNMATFAVMGAITAHKGPKAGGEPKPGEQGGQPGPEGPEGPPRLGRPALFPGTPEILKAGAEYLSAQLRRGRSKADIVKEANDAHDRLAAALEKNPNMTREQVRSLYEDVPPGRLKDLLHTIADAFPADPVPEPPQQGLPQRPQQGPQATPEPPQAPAPAQEPPRSPEAQQAAPEPAAPQQTPQARADALEQAHLKMLQQYQAALRSEAAVKDLVAKGFPKKAELAEARRKRVEAQKALKEIKTELEGVRDEIHSQPAPEQPAEAPPQAPASEPSRAPKAKLNPAAPEGQPEAPAEEGRVEPSKLMTELRSAKSKPKSAVEPDPEREGRYEIAKGGREVGEMIVGPVKDSVSEASAARRIFGDIVRQGETFARVHEVQVEEKHRGKGLGQELIREVMKQHGADWLYNSQASPSLAKSLNAMRDKGEIELHWKGKDGGNFVARLKQQGPEPGIDRPAEEGRVEPSKPMSRVEELESVVRKMALKGGMSEKGIDKALARTRKQVVELGSVDAVDAKMPHGTPSQIWARALARDLFQSRTKPAPEPPVEPAQHALAQGPEPGIDRAAVEPANPEVPAASPAMEDLAKSWRSGKAVELQKVFEATGLTPHERHVMDQRLDGRTLEEIADDEPMLKKNGGRMSRQRVKQIEQAASKKLGLAGDWSMALHQKEAGMDDLLARMEQQGEVNLTDLRFSAEDVRGKAKARRSRKDRIEASIDKIVGQMLKEGENGELSAERREHYERLVRQVEQGEVPGEEREGEPASRPVETAGRKPGEQKAVRRAAPGELREGGETAVPAAEEPPAPAAAHPEGPAAPAGGKTSGNELKPAWQKDVVKAVTEAKAKDKYQLATMPQLYDAAKKAEPGLTIEQFHQGLRDMRAQGLLGRFEPYTRAMADLERNELGLLDSMSGGDPRQGTGNASDQLLWYVNPVEGTAGELPPVASGKNKGLKQPSPSTPQDRLAVLYEKALDPSTDHEGLRREIGQIVSPMSKADAIALGKGFDVGGKSKSEIQQQIESKILDRLKAQKRLASLNRNDPVEEAGKNKGLKKPSEAETRRTAEAKEAGIDPADLQGAAEEIRQQDAALAKQHNEVLAEMFPGQDLESQQGDAGEEGVKPDAMEELKRFFNDEAGTWNVTRTVEVARELWEKVKKAVPYLSDAYKNFAGEIAPRTMRLSPRAGNALAHAHAAPGFVHMATPYLMDRVLGPRAAPEDAVLIGAMMTERRLQYMRQAYLRAGDQNAANAVGSIIGQPYSPFKTLKDYQNLRYSQKGMDAIAAWKEHVVPEMDFYFKMSRGIDPNDPIPNMTQIPGEPINLKHVQEGQARTPSMVKSGAKNLRIQNNRFAQQATGTGDYDLDLGQIIENSLRNNVMPGVKAELFRTLASEGIGQWGTPGRSNILVQGEKSVEIPFTNPPRGTQAAGVGETSFYIHPNAYNEVMDYLNVDRSPGAMMQGTKAAMDLVTRIAMASSTEAVYHMQNMLTLLMKPGVSPFKLINNVVGLARKNPELQKRLVELSRMGATRDYGSELEKTEAGKGGVLWGGKTDPTYHVSRGLHLMDQAMRLTMEDAYESFKDAGIAEASEENKRNFINQLGQYIKTAQPWIVRFLRDTGIGPFATAGTNFWVQGLRQLTLNPGLKATSPLAAINLRLRMLGRALAAMSIPAILNFLRWGRVDGDENTPWGAIKLSRDAYGKTKYVDFLAATGITRGLRETGFLAFVQSRQSGATMGEAAARGGEDVAHGLIHPAAGPGVQAGTIAVTGKNTQGWQVAKKDENKKSDVGNNFLAAFMNMNPTIATVFGWDRANEKLSSERFYRLMGRYAPKEAKHPR